MLVLLQTKGVLTRPWCLIELYQALKANVPIVAVNMQSMAFPYDYGEAAEILNTLASPTGKLAGINPGAHAVITGPDGGYTDLQDMQDLLSATIPKLISKTYNSSGTSRMIGAQIEDIVETMLTEIAKDRDAVVVKTTHAETISTTTTTGTKRSSFVVVSAEEASRPEQ